MVVQYRSNCGASKAIGEGGPDPRRRIEGQAPSGIPVISRTQQGATRLRQYRLDDASRQRMAVDK